MTEAEYMQAMAEAKAEYDQWLRDSKKNRKMTKEKFKAIRLAKLHMKEISSF